MTGMRWGRGLLSVAATVAALVGAVACSADNTPPESYANDVTLSVKLPHAAQVQATDFGRRYVVEAEVEDDAAAPRSTEAYAMLRPWDGDVGAHSFRLSDEADGERSQGDDALVGLLLQRNGSTTDAQEVWEDRPPLLIADTVATNDLSDEEIRAKAPTLAYRPPPGESARTWSSTCLTNDRRTCGAVANWVRVCEYNLLVQAEVFGIDTAVDEPAVQAFSEEMTSLVARQVGCTR